MSYVIRNLGSMMDKSLIGLYLKSYNPDLFNGRGKAQWTTDPSEAMHFVSHEAALICWRQQSKCRPTRRDGRPNRPLTAYTVEVIALDDDGKPTLSLSTECHDRPL